MYGKSLNKTTMIHSNIQHHFYTITDCIKEKTKLFCGNVNCVTLCKQNVNRIIKTVVETKQPNN